MTPLPAGPTAPPFIQLWRWIRGALPLLEECQARYGDVFTIRVPGLAPFVVFSDPGAIKEIFTSSTDEIVAGEANFVIEGLLGPNSIMLLDGPPHLHRRRLMMPSFRGEHMAAFCSTIESITERSLASWPRGRTFPLHRAMQTITLETILHTVFGVEGGPRLDELRKLLQSALEQVSNPAFVFLTMLISSERIRRMSSLMARARKFTPLSRVDEIVYQQIAEYRRGGADKPTNILKTLMSARDENGHGLSDSDLHGQLLSLLIAGFETTSGALCWAFQHILSNEAVRARVEAEIHAVIGSEPLRPEHVAKLDYLEAVIHESMRVQPLMPVVVRFTRAPVTIAGIDLPAGVYLAPSTHLVHHRPELWSDPHEFRPERFLNARPDPYEFFPFGGGVRRCMGQAFALYEMKVVVATALRRLRLALPNSYRATPVRRAIAWVPARGTPVRVEAELPRPARASEARPLSDAAARCPFDATRGQA